MSATTGAPLSGAAHVQQSVGDILSTPIGSRVLVRDYGSRLRDLVDAPVNSETLALMRAATAEAIRKWEPRVRLRTVQILSVNPGAISIQLTLNVVDSGETLIFDILV